MLQFGKGTPPGMVGPTNPQPGMTFETPLLPMISPAPIVPCRPLGEQLHVVLSLVVQPQLNTDVPPFGQVPVAAKGVSPLTQAWTQLEKSNDFSALTVVQITWFAFGPGSRSSLAVALAVARVVSRPSRSR